MPKASEQAGRSSRNNLDRYFTVGGCQTLHFPPVDELRPPREAKAPRCAGLCVLCSRHGQPAPKNIHLSSARQPLCWQDQRQLSSKSWRPRPGSAEPQLPHPTLPAGLLGVHLPRIRGLGSPRAQVASARTHNIPCTCISGHLPKSERIWPLLCMDSALKEKTFYGVNRNRVWSGDCEASKCQMCKTKGALVLKTDRLQK